MEDIQIELEELLNGRPHSANDSQFKTGERAAYDLLLSGSDMTADELYYYALGWNMRREIEHEQ